MLYCTRNATIINHQQNSKVRILKLYKNNGKVFLNTFKCHAHASIIFNEQKFKINKSENLVNVYYTPEKFQLHAAENSQMFKSFNNSK